MNKIVASVGVAALGVSGLQLARAEDAGAPPGKPWSVSASLRGFYDDNINTSADGTPRQAVWGLEVSPGIDLNFVNDQNTFTAGYRYSLRVYDHQPAGTAQKYDQDHTFIAAWLHNFNERVSLSIRDSFVIGQEPDLLRAGATLTDFQRVPGDNIRNYGTIVLDWQFTPLFGIEAGYGNTYFNYHDSGGTAAQPSLSGTSDRIENRFNVDGRWTISPTTTLLVGYQYRQINYTGDEPIGQLFPPIGPILMSEARDSRSHYGYAGVEHKFLPNLAGSLKGGATFTDYYNDPNNSSDVSPYVAASLRYLYAPESFVEAGFTYDRNATDQVSISGGSFALDQQSAVLYGTIQHRIIPRLYGSIVGQFQSSEFNGGQFDGNTDNYYLLGVNLRYQFNPYLSAEIGYNYDKLDSDIPISAVPGSPTRTFDRNRVYIGVTARY